MIAQCILKCKWVHSEPAEAGIAVRQQWAFPGARALKTLRLIRNGINLRLNNLINTYSLKRFYLKKVFLSVPSRVIFIDRPCRLAIDIGENRVEG